MLLLSSTYAQEQNFSFYIDGEDIEGAEIDILPIDDSEYVVNKNFIPNGPTVIKAVSRNMKSSGYWISKIKNPDKEILTKEQIKEKNKELFRDLIYLNNIFCTSYHFRKHMVNCEDALLLHQDLYT